MAADPEAVAGHPPTTGEDLPYPFWFFCGDDWHHKTACKKISNETGL